MWREPDAQAFNFVCRLRPAPPRFRFAAAKGVIVGVNVYDEGNITQAQQDAEVDRLAGYGVNTIRTGFSAKSAYFITRAFQHGIGTVAVVYPSGGSTVKSKTRWSDFPLAQPLDEKLRAPGTGTELGGFNPTKIEKIDAQTVRVWPSNRIKPEIGRLYLLRRYTYEKHGVAMGGNSHLSLRNVNIYSFPGIGFITGGDHMGVHRVDGYTLVATQIVALRCPFVAGDPV